MGEIVNLNRYRKALAKQESAKEARDNRARHGRTKADRERERKETARQAEDLDDKKLD